MVSPSAQDDTTPSTSATLACSALNIGADGVPAAFSVDASAAASAIPSGATLFASLASSDIASGLPIAAGIVASTSTAQELENQMATFNLTSGLTAGTTYNASCAGAYYLIDGTGPVYLTQSTVSFTYNPSA